MPRRQGHAKQDIVVNANVQLFIHDRKAVRGDPEHGLGDLDTILDSVRRYRDFEDPRRPRLTRKQQLELLHNHLRPRGIKDFDEGHNKAVTIGLTEIGNVWMNKTTNFPGWCSVGTDGTAPADSDTQLISEVARKAISRSFQNGVISNLDTLFNENEGNGTLLEVGLHWASSGNNNLYFRRNFPAPGKIKTTGDTMTNKWDITWSSGT